MTLRRHHYEIICSYRCENLLGSEHFSHFIVAGSLSRECKYPADYFRGRLVHDQVMPVLGVELVAERRLRADELTRPCFRFLGGLGFL